LPRRGGPRDHQKASGQTGSLSRKSPPGSAPHFKIPRSTKMPVAPRPFRNIHNLNRAKLFERLGAPFIFQVVGSRTRNADHDALSRGDVAAHFGYRGPCYQSESLSRAKGRSHRWLGTDSGRPCNAHLARSTICARRALVLRAQATKARNRIANVVHVSDRAVRPNAAVRVRSARGERPAT